MPTLVLPLVMAAAFTAGCIAIHGARRHAAAVGHALGVAFSVVVALLIVEALVRALPPPGAGAPTERAARVPARE